MTESKEFANIWIPNDLYDTIKSIAEAEERDTDAQIRYIIKTYIDFWMRDNG